MSDLEKSDCTTSEQSSSEEEEDENGGEWNEEIEKTFLKTLSSLKSKDPKIYDENVKFFNEEPITSKDDKSSITDKKEKPLYLRDYERKIILEKNGILTDEESDEESMKQEKIKRSQSPSYVEEQRIIKENFKKFVNNDNENTDDENDCAGFLKIKVKTSEQKIKEEEEFVEWLKGQKSELNDKETEYQLKYLKDYWMNPDLNQGEQFLRDYILNKRYLDPNTTSNGVKDEVSFSEEEKILEECEEYEQNYNFRFEEPDKHFIKTYPRNIETSLRRKDEKRKKKREERKKRKEEELKQKHLEVKKLKQEKKEELLEKIRKLKEITGNDELGFDALNLQDEFNPDEYDIKMKELFNEEFYANEDDTKPTFSDSDIEFENCDNENDYVNNDINVDDEISVEDPHFVMDCDYDPQNIQESKFKKQTRSSHRKGHKKSKFAEIISKEKPVFNPTDKTFQQYVDEYYSLEFEDIVGDIPCRFKYRKVIPNSFGLTVEEILAADDKELNKWCSMQKIDTIRPEQNEKFDLKIFSRRGHDLNLKKKFLPSLFKDENDTNMNQENHSQKKKKKKKRKCKLTKVIEKNNNNNNNVSEEKNINQAIISSHINHKKSKKRKAVSDINQEIIKKPKLKTDFQNNNLLKSKSVKKSNKYNKSLFQNLKKNDSECIGISDDRLKAYGINPKKYKNKLKYGGNKQ